MKKSNKIIIAVLIAVMAVSIFVIAYCSVIGLTGKRKTPETEQSSGTESTNGTETSSEDVQPPEKPDKVIALTFDDGPSLSVTPKILDLLEKYGAKATFFPVGYNLTESKMAYLRRALSMGCEIGNHSDSHPISLTRLTDEEILREITEVNRKLASLTENGYVPKLMRPPGGNIDRDVMEVLYSGGVRMYSILWNADSRDWEFNKRYLDGEITYEQAVDGAVELVLSEARDGGIILMHDIKDITPAVLERVLESLSEEGYTFVTVSELFDFDDMGKNAYFSEFYSEGNIVTAD